MRLTSLEGKVNFQRTMCSGEVRSPLRLPRHPAIQPNVLFVWAAISERGIIGPFFFEEHGAQVTVTKERYMEVLEDFKKEQESLYPSLMTKIWFQQDGASSHTSNMSRETLGSVSSVTRPILSGPPIARI